MTNSEVSVSLIQRAHGKSVRAGSSGYPNNLLKVADKLAPREKAHADHQPVLRDHHPDVLARACATALTWPNGADLDPMWVHEEIGKNKTWAVPDWLASSCFHIGV